jgi:hypothetical protein
MTKKKEDPKMDRHREIITRLMVMREMQSRQTIPYLTLSKKISTYL